MEDIREMLHKYGSPSFKESKNNIPVNRLKEINEVKLRLEEEQHTNSNLKIKIDHLENLLQEQLNVLKNKNTELSSLHSYLAKNEEELQRVKDDMLSNKNHLKSKLEEDKKFTEQAMRLKKQLEDERKISRRLEEELSLMQASFENERKLREAIESNLKNAGAKTKKIQEELDFVIEYNKEEKNNAFREFTTFGEDVEKFLDSCRMHHKNIVILTDMKSKQGVQNE